MVNFCHQRLTVLSGPRQRVKELFGTIRPSEEEWEEHGCNRLIDFERIIPSPPEDSFSKLETWKKTRKIAPPPTSRWRAAIARLAAPLYYISYFMYDWTFTPLGQLEEWQLAHWGALNSCTTEDKTQHEPDTVFFHTVGFPSDLVMEHLSRTFPELVIRWEYYDEGYSLAVSIELKGGERIKETKYDHFMPEQKQIRDRIFADKQRHDHHASGNHLQTEDKC
jgi:hypothetical protein